MELKQAETLPSRELNTTMSEAQRRLLEQKMRGRRPTPSSVIARRPAGTNVPLSTEQQRIWLHSLQHPGSALYNEPITLHRFGSYNHETLEAAFNQIIQRHEVFRTRFTAEGSSVIQGQLTIKIPFTDLSEVSSTQREDKANAIAEKAAKEPIPLDELPLFRALSVRLSADVHRLYLTFHHIIVDGISFSNVLLPELAAIYAALEGGETSPLSEPKLQYGDYSVWREEKGRDYVDPQHLRYWLAQLSGVLPILELPTDRPRTAFGSQRGAMETFQIPSDLSNRLRSLCRQNGVTPYVLLLTVFKVLLFRYSNQGDLIIGSATDARRKPELAGVMGYFLDTIALRTRPQADTAFLEYLGQVRSVVFEAISAADVPFDRIVHEVKPKRDSSHHAIFQTFFSMRPELLETPLGWDLTHMDVSVGASKFDLYLELGERKEFIEGRFLYSMDLFDAATVNRMVAHWLTLLEAVCTDPTETIGRLEMLTSEERMFLLGEDKWNKTNESFPQQPLHFLFEAQVERTPSALAACCGSKAFSYRDLDLRSNAIAEILRSTGVCAGSLVAVVVDRSLDLLASLIAVLKLRAAYLPIDIYMPTERIALCLADAQPAAIISEHSLYAHVAAQPFPTVILEDIPTVDTTSRLLATTEQCSMMDDSAYVIYTSGTTGAPKAVEITQRSLVNLLTSMRACPGFTAEDTMLAITSASFDIAALELFLPLICGGTVVIATRQEVQDPHKLATLIRESECTVMQGTPATWRTLLFSGWNDATLAPVSGRIRTLKLLCGGEALTGELADHLLATGAELWNMYGPTETTIWSTIQRVLLEDKQRVAPVSIGHPIANTQMYILDPQKQLVPLGVTGELFLGGAGLAKGYRGQPQQTSERFIAVDVVGGARLYRTGDLAVRRSADVVQLRGRTDHQVKIRGYRVELEAVEAAALQHSQVSGAAARVWTEATGDNRLSLYVVGNGTTAVNVIELKSFLASRLPTYMVPSDIVPLAAIPLTANGKTDRSQLPEPLVSDVSQASLDDFSGYEETIAHIWSELLRVASIDRDQNFFDLGGHSILVAALQRRICEKTTQKLPMAELFHSPTIRKQAALLQQATEKTPNLPSGVLALQPAGSGNPVFWVHYANDSLASALGNAQPFLSVVLTIEDVIAMGNAPTFRQIAQCHVDKMLATQPSGPFCIGGFCAGGVLAYEVASMLQEAGHVVSLLIIIDSPNPSPPRMLKLFHYCQWIAKAGGVKALRRTIGKHLQERLRKRSAEIAEQTEMRVTQDMIEVAAASYRPHEYKGEVLLIQASDRLHLDFLYGWRAVIKDRLHNEYAPGHHDDLMKQHRVKEVGLIITKHLNRQQP